MARLLRGVYLTINSVNLSSFLREVELSYEVDEKEVTTLADSTNLSFPGLKKWRLSGKFLQSFASSEVEQTLYSLVGNETAVPIEIRPTNSAVSATNPKYTGSGYLLKFPPISGGVGDIHEVDFEIAAATDLTRATV